MWALNIYTGLSWKAVRGAGLDGDVSNIWALWWAWLSCASESFCCILGSLVWHECTVTQHQQMFALVLGFLCVASWWKQHSYFQERKLLLSTYNTRCSASLGVQKQNIKQTKKTKLNGTKLKIFPPLHDILYLNAFSKNYSVKHDTARCNRGRQNILGFR